VIDVASLADGTRSPSLFADLAAQCVRAGVIAIFSTALPRASDRLRLREHLGPEQLLVVPVENDPPVSSRGYSTGLAHALPVDEPDRAISLLSKVIEQRCGVSSSD
jgi:hypothetical protein